MTGSVVDVLFAADFFSLLTCLRVIGAINARILLFTLIALLTTRKKAVV